MPRRLQTQGNPDKTRFDDVFPRYAYFFKRYGFKKAYLIRACGVQNPGEVEARQDLLNLAEETARKILT